MHDVLIIGGGVIGLSLAWDLARHGSSVQVVDRQELGREASWAGAGILPAAVYSADSHPIDQLRGLACELHPNWSSDLKAATGIDNGYWRCGGLNLARTPGEAASLAAWARLSREEGIPVEHLSPARLAEIEPGLVSFAERSAPHTSYFIPSESQLRNPWHLKALKAACQSAGVELTPNTAIDDIECANGEIKLLRTATGSLTARQYCFTSGAWTGQLLQRLGIHLGIIPIRGQMVLFRCEQPPIIRVINEGSRYLVPRQDGYVLAGSTEEEVGFDKRTTEDTIAELTQFARDLVPALATATIEQTWAGLRPGSFDGLPYLGPLPNLSNAHLAAGHFRTGLYLSPATAQLMSQLIRGQKPQIDLSPFRVLR